MTATTAPKTIARLDSLTGVRALAAFLVFWHHGADQFEGAHSAGMVGVSLFYMLSGFVMAWVDREGDTAGQFFRRRFARIYPAYAVAVLVAIGFAILGSRFAVTDLSAFTLLQSWIPSESFYFAANAVFWSLSCEAFFYLVYPGLRRLVRSLAQRGLATLAGAATVVSLSIAGVAALSAPTELTTWAVVVFPPARLPEFVIGVALGALMARGWRPRAPLWPAFALSVVAVAGAVFAPYALSRYAVTLIPFALLIIALASADLAGKRIFTQWAPLVKLGVWSYCFYLVHLMVLNRVEGVSDSMGLPPLVSVLVALPTSIVAAWLLHIVVEKPLEKRLRPAARARLDND